MVCLVTMIQVSAELSESHIPELPAWASRRNGGRNAEPWLTLSEVGTRKSVKALAQLFPSLAFCWDCFVGFRWILNRDLTFKAEDRHFRLEIAPQLLGMFLLGVFGVMLPMRAIADTNPEFLFDYREVVLWLIAIFEYMLTNLGHHCVLQVAQIQNSTRDKFVC
jgi:hypothetical protein